MVKYKTRTCSSFDTLVKHYSKRELASPARSTVPLLAYWSGLEAKLPELANALPFGLPTNMDMCFEYPVPVQQGKGKASYTDLMLNSLEHAVAIEAKYTEPAYETTRIWLGSSDNRRQVLGGWLELINSAIGADLRIDDVTDWTYQVIHRTASVCAQDAGKRSVVYQYFGRTDTGRKYYESQLAALSSRIGKTPKLGFYLVCVPLIKRTEYEVLEKLWLAGDRDLSDQVKQGLIQKTLLDFGTPTVHIS